MTKIKNLIFLAGLLAGTSSVLAHGAENNTLRSKVYSGPRAIQHCEQDSAAITAAFPTAAAADAFIRLINVPCEALSQDRYQLSVVYRHEGGSVLASRSQKFANPETCRAAIAPARARFDQARLATVFAYCGAEGDPATLVVDFVSPVQVSHRVYNDSPKLATIEACQARLRGLKRAFAENEIFTLLSGCVAYDSPVDPGKPYYSTTVTYAISPRTILTALQGGRTARAEDCEAELRAIRRRFDSVELPVADAYCMKDGRGFRQVISYVDEAGPRLTLYDGSTLPTANHCEQARSRLEADLVSRNGIIVLSYCAEVLDRRDEIEGYRYMVYCSASDEN